MQNLGRPHPPLLSGVVVDAPYLVIAPAGNAVIRLDLRMLDRVRMYVDEYGHETDEVDRRTIVLVCGDVEVALDIIDGPEAATGIAREATTWTREHAGASRPLPERTTSARRHGRLHVLSSTPDGAQSPDDPLAGATFELTEPVTRVGRARENDIVLDHRSISSNHARLTRDATTGGYSIADLEATNGVRINGTECTEAALHDYDTVDLGHVRMRFRAPNDAVEGLLVVGNDAVVVHGEYIQIGTLAFRIEEVDRYALAGAYLPLIGGRLIQAAIAMLAVAAA